MSEFIEELFDIDTDELEEIVKANLSKYDYPVVHLSCSVMFNRHCASILEGMEAVKFFVSPQYVVALPAKTGDRNSYAIRYPGRNSGNSRSISTTFPAQLRYEKKLQTGYYRLYKYKNGFAFKRYEPIAENN